MGRHNFRAARVYQTATHFLETQRGTVHAPPWYGTIGTIPPGEILTRPQPVQLREPSTKRRTKKASQLFKPQAITYEEDKLRTNFYTDHPWELARPRIILEQDGKDGQRNDWSRIQQPGRQLDGESVIQRQLWLLQNVPGMTSAKAYDLARKEFYAIRHAEDIERRVAREEAMSTGAYFGKTILDISMELEDQSYEDWKDAALKEVELLEQQKSAAYTGADGQPEVEEDTAVDSSLDDVVAESA